MDLNYFEYGDGKPVVILHGLFGSAKNWSSIAKQMGRSYHIFAVDLRNHGQSPRSEDMSYEAMAGDLVDFLDARGLDKAAIVGHSMGGKAAMTLALLHPERVERLCVVDIAPVAYKLAFKAFADAMMAIDLSKLTRRAEADEYLKPAVADQGVRAFLLGNLVNGATGLDWAVNLQVLARDMAQIGGVPAIGTTKRYMGPCLFLGGAKSDYILPSHHQLIKTFFNNALIDYVEGAGHWVHAEQPYAFMERLSAFLDTQA